jgi:DNA-binding NtrC family response regulator
MLTEEQKESTKKRVLLVDDEPEIPNGLIRALRDLPYVFFAANSGAQALDILSRIPIDVIVADEKMPGMPGSALVAKVRQLYPRIVRIMLTGHASVRSAISAIQDGCVFQYLQKPCSPADLASCIHNGLLLQSFLLPDEDLAMSTTDQETLIVTVAASQNGPLSHRSDPTRNLDSGSPGKAV